MAERKRSPARAGSVRSARSERKRRVLLVDDEEDVRALYGTYFRHSGWDVEAVTNGSEALHVARSFAPDVIVMDLAMPELDGVQATQRLKRDLDLRKIPVVVLTAHPGRTGAAIHAGCDDVLLKPCTPSDLQKVLVRAIATSEERGG